MFSRNEPNTEIRVKIIIKCRMMNRVGYMVFVIDSFEGVITGSEQERRHELWMSLISRTKIRIDFSLHQNMVLKS